jgi:cysteine desulfurase/selenocysteine lyase
MSLNWEEIRTSQFPITKTSTYLMAASSSPLCINAHRNGIEYFNAMLSEGDLNYDHFCEFRDETRKMIGQYLNANPDDVAFLPNTSSGMTAIASLLHNARGEILYPSIEFPSSIHPFKKLHFECKKILPIQNQYQVNTFTDFLSENTEYIVHSHVQSLTGFSQDLWHLMRFCREHNLTKIINATQSFGALTIDVKKYEIDFLTANPLKWGCCGYGAAFVYINGKMLSDHEIPFSSWLSVENPFSLDNDNMHIINKTRYMDSMGGTSNFAAILSLKGALDLLKFTIGGGDIQEGIKKVQQRIFQLTDKFIEELRELPIKIITPLEKECRSGIITLDHHKAEEINEYFRKNRIYVTLKKNPGDQIHTMLRFAFHYYNNEDDITTAIKALKFLLLQV